MHMPTTTEKLKRQKMVLNPRPQETTGTCFGGYTAEFYDEKNFRSFFVTFYATRLYYLYKAL